MDGRMRPYLPELTIRDYNIYQWYLRGVQYQLNTTYGLYSCSQLQHNGVLFALLSDSLAGGRRPAKGAPALDTLLEADDVPDPGHPAGRAGGGAAGLA